MLVWANLIAHLVYLKQTPLYYMIPSWDKDILS